MLAEILFREERKLRWGSRFARDPRVSALPRLTPASDDEISRAAAASSVLPAAKSGSATALNSKRSKRAWHSHGLATVLAHRRRSLSSD
jgi:hypothetical protein